MASQRPEVWPLERVRQLAPEATVWTSPSLAGRVRAAFGQEPVLWPAVPAAPKPNVVVVGGGSLLDAAKRWRVEHAAHVTLVAIPSLWGSGAENSPVVVFEDAQNPLLKQALIGEQYLPDVRAIWPELADSLSASQRSTALGDAWSHALEGFLSPLASDSLREEGATLLKALGALDSDDAAATFALSAQACRLQSNSSVGLIHGIAHTVEGPLRAAEPDNDVGHAALCATFLWPVFRYNLDHSSKPKSLFEAHALSVDRLESSFRALFDRELYEQALPIVQAHWKRIVRDPCTRTNCALVRPSALSYFETWAAS